MMEDHTDNIIVLDSLSLGYTAGKHPKPILPPLSASSTGGELIAVIGRNGIGKSTLLRTITGLQSPLGGDIFISGRSYSEYSRLEIARRIGYISTEVIKVSNMSVYDLVTLGRFPHTNWLGNLNQADKFAIENSIERTGLISFRSRSISEISDGERQKAMLARVLAQDTDLMVMDEPTAFLDIASKYEIVNLMISLTREGKTIIFSTHDFNVAINQADKVWLMLDDKLIEGAPEDLILSGVLEYLFNSSLIKFNSTDGSFSFRNESHGNVHIKGDGIFRKWTERAVSRAGFELSGPMTDPYIQVPEEPGAQWLLICNKNTLRFGSVYDLIRQLRK
jgi:cobalamin transport system ATP-binding protein